MVRERGKERKKVLVAQPAEEKRGRHSTETGAGQSWGQALFHLCDFREHFQQTKLSQRPAGIQPGQKLRHLQRFHLSFSPNPSWMQILSAVRLHFQASYKPQRRNHCAAQKKRYCQSIKVPRPSSQGVREDGEFWGGKRHA